MEKLRFSVEIKAPKQRVWDVLWDDQTFRQWAGIIDPGTYMVGELKEGGEIQFISAENGYGVTSLVAELTPGEYLLLKHQADTQDSGTHERKEQWTGGQESYRLEQKNDNTILTVEFDAPKEIKDVLAVSYPKALQRIKEFAEHGLL